MRANVNADNEVGIENVIVRPLSTVGYTSV